MKNQIQRKNPFWSLAGPLIGFLLIQSATQFLIRLGLELPYIAQAYAGLMREAGNGTALTIQDIWDSYARALEPAMEMILRWQVVIATVSGLATMILTGILFAKDRRLEKACGIALPKKEPLREYWTILVLGAVGSIVVTCLMVMAQAVFSDAAYQQTAESMYSAGIAEQIIGLGILLPISEELMFRGILYKRLHERQPFWYAAIWSSVMFAFLHSNTTQMIYAFLLGLMLSYVYEKFGSFRAPAFLHIVLNTGSVAFTELGVFGWLAADPVRMAAASIIGAFICSVMFVKIQRMENVVNPDAAEKNSGPTDMF